MKRKRMNMTSLKEKQKKIIKTNNDFSQKILIRFIKKISLSGYELEE